MRNSKMPSKVCMIAAAVIILIMIIAANSLLSYLLCPYSSIRYEMHVMKKGNIEQVAVGTSHGKCGIDPSVLTEQTGLETFNLCRGGEYPVDTLYLVKFAAKHNKLKRVLYEVDPAYWILKPNQTADYSMFYREMPWGAEKAGYFADKMLSADYRTIVTPWYMFRNNIKKIPEIVEEKKTAVYKNYMIADDFSTEGQTYSDRGFLAINRLATDRISEDTPLLWSGEAPRKESLRAVRRLIGFCEKQGIELVMVMAPIPKDTYEKYKENYDAALEYMNEFSRENNVKLLSYWNSDDECVPRKSDDFVDYDGHMYKESAAAFTEIIAEELEKL